MLKRLRSALTSPGITQVEAARALRRIQAFISKCELGEGRIDLIDLEDFAALYDARLSTSLS
jgi:hypothetical protein